MLYEQGLGVKADLTAAYLWYSLAAAQGQVNAIRHRTRISAQLSANDLAAADRAVQEWRPHSHDLTRERETLLVGR